MTDDRRADTETRGGAAAERARAAPLHHKINNGREYRRKHPFINIKKIGGLKLWEK
jgi:hypothetical protein